MKKICYLLFSLFLCSSVAGASGVGDGVSNSKKTAGKSDRTTVGWTTIVNGDMWVDSDGKDVQAHGAGFLKVGDTWYMIGEDRSDMWHPDVNMYSSKDFVNWKFERKIISPDTHPALADGSRFIERPKLMYCKKTGKYVVWCHWEQGNYGASEAAVFYCDSVNGPYKFHWAGRPLGIKSRDCNVFVDDDGTAYFISTTNENQDLGLFKLSDDYLSAVSHTTLFAGDRREAPAIVRVGNTYFMLSSACTGWDPNQCKVAHSKSLTSGWSELSDVGNNIAFDTQAASVLKIPNKNGFSYLYVGDRWQDPDLPSSKTIVFPIEFKDGKCIFDYRRTFDMNWKTGEWKSSAPENVISKRGWKLRGYSSQETEAEQCEAYKAIDGDFKTMWHAKYSSPAPFPHYLEVDMGRVYDVSAFLCTPRSDKSSGGLIRGYKLEVSMDGIVWTEVSGGKWLPYFTKVGFDKTKARYFRFTAFSRDASIAEFDMIQ